MPDLVTCPSCGKRYRRPQDGPEAVACRACGARIVLRAPPPSPALPRRRRALRGRGHGPNPDSDEAITRQEVGRAIGHAHRGLKAMRWLFAGDALLVGLLLLLVARSETVPEWLKFTFGALFVAAIVGAVFVVRLPLACTAGLAVFHSVLAALVIGLGLQGLFPASVVTLALLTWGATAMAFNTQKLLKQFPDAWAARRMRGERREDMGSRWRDQSRAEKAAARKRMVLAFGIPVVLAIAAFAFLGGGDDESGSGGARRGPPPKPTVALEPSLDRFRIAWNESDHDGVKAQVSRLELSRIARLLGKIWRRRQWTETLPTITLDRTEEANAWQVAVFWQVEGYGAMQTDWEWEKSQWVLVGFRFKKA